MRKRAGSSLPDPEIIDISYGQMAFLFSLGSTLERIDYFDFFRFFVVVQFIVKEQIGKVDPLGMWDRGS